MIILTTPPIAIIIIITMIIRIILSRILLQYYIVRPPHHTDDLDGSPPRLFRPKVRSLAVINAFRFVYPYKYNDIIVHEIKTFEWKRNANILPDRCWGTGTVRRRWSRSTRLFFSATWEPFGTGPHCRTCRQC